MESINLKANPNTLALPEENKKSQDKNYLVLPGNGAGKTSRLQSDENIIEYRSKSSQNSRNSS